MIDKLVETHKDFDYVCYGKEVGENGTPHLQGYIELCRAVTFPKVKAAMGGRVHLEPRRGTQAQAIEYCMKDGKFFEFGEKKQSTKNDELAACKNKTLMYSDRIKAGDWTSILDDPDLTLYTLKFIQAVAPYKELPREIEPDELRVRWYWGPSGTGKSRRALWEAKQLYDRRMVYKKMCDKNNKWWEGYEGQRAVILDELRNTSFEYSYLLSLLDIYEMRVECKGGSRQYQARDVWVTCPYHPRDMFQNMQERNPEIDSIEQLVRRCHVIEHMPMTPFGKWTPPNGTAAATTLTGDVHDDETSIAPTEPVSPRTPTMTQVWGAAEETQLFPCPTQDIPDDTPDWNQ